MKALSVKQPYASWIASGEKTVELRTWQTKHRGEFLLCSSAKAFPGSETEPLGVCLGVCRLVNVRKATKKDARLARTTKTEGLYAWEIEFSHAWKTPFKVKGRQGLYNVALSQESLKELKRNGLPVAKTSFFARIKAIVWPAKLP